MDLIKEITLTLSEIDKKEFESFLTRKDLAQIEKILMYFATCIMIIMVIQMLRKAILEIRITMPSEKD